MPPTLFNGSANYRQHKIKEVIYLQRSVFLSKFVTDYARSIGKSEELHPSAPSFGRRGTGVGRLKWRTRFRMPCPHLGQSGLRSGGSALQFSPEGRREPARRAICSITLPADGMGTAPGRFRHTDLCPASENQHRNGSTRIAVRALPFTPA